MIQTYIPLRLVVYHSSLDLQGGYGNNGEKRPSISQGGL